MEQAIGTAVGGGTSVGGGLLGKGSVKKARKRAVRQLHHADTALQAGMEQSLDAIDTGQDEASAELEAYAGLGTGSLAKLAYGLGFDVPGFDTTGLQRGSLLKNFDEAEFRKDPGYEFVRDEGLRGIERGASARGSVLSGRTLKALTRFNQGLADQQYQRSYDRYNQDRKLQSELLSGVGRMGLDASARRAGYAFDAGQSRANTITGRYNSLAGLHADLGGLQANLALRSGNFARDALSGVGNSLQSGFSSFFSK
jgi:hypothetical protein